MSIQSKLLDWYDMNARELPWRSTSDPYRIWLSEIMLQQTRTETVVRYYNRFLEEFPSVLALASAELDRVFKLWEGLGYYSRARNLHHCAVKVAQDYNGVFPDTSDALRKLPGIGPYTANAIASIAFHEPVPALDGNQARVLSRILAFSEPLRTPFDLYEPAMRLLSKNRPGDYNQALMDLGATVCLPKRADCNQCPLQSECLAAASDTPTDFPVRKPPILKREMDVTVIVVRSKDSPSVYLFRRPNQGLLSGLYTFPVYEEPLDKHQAVHRLESEGFTEPIILAPLAPARHVFTHLIWNMTGWLAEAAQAPSGWIRVTDFSSTAIPSALRVYRTYAEKMLAGVPFASDRSIPYA